MFQDRTKPNSVSSRTPFAYKSEDESVTASATLHDDTELSVNLDAGGIYAFECALFFELIGPLCNVAFSNGTDLTASYFRMGLVESGTPTENLGDMADLISVGRPSILVGAIEVTTSGTFQLQWKQSTASGQTTLQGGSYLIAWRLN